MALRKLARHETIRRLIREERLSTQVSIQKRLKDCGFSITQTTLSRDMHELSLIKVHDNKEKVSYYVLAEDQEKNVFIHHLSAYILKLTRVQFMLVIHTQLGETGVAANLVDKANHHAIIGTVAGADTLLLICPDEQVASQLENTLRQAMEERQEK